MLVGNGVALVRPRPPQHDGELVRAPVARTVVMMVIGLVASVWAVASLVQG